MTKLMRLIAQIEGFYTPGSVPNRNNNPGDLRHSPHSSHPVGKPDAIGIIDTLEHGWEDLARQINLDAKRGLTLKQFVEKFAPRSENNSQNYLNFLCKGLNCLPDIALNLVKDVEDFVVKPFPGQPRLPKIIT